MSEQLLGVTPPARRVGQGSECKVPSRRNGGGHRDQKLALSEGTGAPSNLPLDITAARVLSQA